MRGGMLLHLLSASAKFDDAGATVGPSGEELGGLTIRTTAWGRVADRQSVSLGAARMGACATEAQADGTCVRRIEYEGEGVVEWYLALDGGLEQGWSVLNRPRGEGLLSFEVDLTGAEDVEVSGEGARLRDASGRSWSVGHVAAWDASGASLPASLRVDGSGVVIDVDDVGAVYPIEVDPVYTTAATIFEGEAAPDAFGAAVAGAGDVNDDGFDDVVIGAYVHGPGPGLRVLRKRDGFVGGCGHHPGWRDCRGPIRIGGRRRGGT